MAATDSSSFALRWACVVSAVGLMQFSGSYCYAMYSAALKEVLQINQVELNTLSVCKDLGDALGVVAGVMSNFIPPWALLTIAAAAGFLGYGAQWLVVSHSISPLPYWQMCLAALVAANCVSWINTATFMVSVGNFPRNRGPVVGLFKAYMGLTAAIYSVLCHGLFSNSPSKLLLMLTFVPASFCLIAAVFLRPLPPAASDEEEKEEKQGIFLFNVVAITLALYLAFMDVYLPSKPAIKALLLALLFLILAAPILVPLSLCLRPIEKQKGNIMREPLLKECPEKNACKSESKGCFGDLPELGEDRNTLQMLRSWDFILFYIACFCAIGAGATFNNNLGQIGQAMGYKSVTLFASLFSLGNFFGRILAGNVSEYFLRRMGTPRSLWMGGAKVPMIAMFAWMARGSATSLYVGSTVLGLCHGLHFTLMIPMVSEFYGLAYFGTNYTVSTTVLLAGSFVFSGLLAGRLYDYEAYKQTYGGRSSSNTCVGPKCYGPTFLILSAVLLAATVLDGILYLASRKLYKHLQKINTSSSSTVTHDTP